MSLTIIGVIVSVAGAGLIQFGFTEGCANEIVSYLPVVIGGIMSWVGRVRAGGVDVLGRRV
jgi:hypothetical protein